MSPQLIELLLRQLKGRLLRWLRMLRKPKYSIATVFGLLYFWFVIGRQTLEPGGPSMIPMERFQSLREMIHPLAAVLLAALFTITWLVPPKRPRLGLTEAELHNLLAAPISRQGLLRYALLKAQMMVLLSATLLAVLSRSWSLIPLYWLTLTLLDMHLKACSFWQLRQAQTTASENRRRLLPLAFLGFFWFLLLPHLIDLSQGLFAILTDQPEDMMAALTVLAQRLESNLAGVLLAPFSWAIAPLFSFPDHSWLPFAVLWLGHYAWVTHGTRGFEEAALRHVRQQSTSREGRRRQSLTDKNRQRVPFALAANGAPETAIAWKNWLLLKRTPLRQQAFGLLAVVAGLFAITLATGSPPVLLVIEAIAGGWLALLIPPLAGMMFRQDFRVDLQRTDILRSWPLRGWQLVAAEIQVPVVMATTLSAAGLGLLLTALYGARSQNIDLSALETFSQGPSRLLPLALALGALPILTGIAGLSSILQNLGTLLWPSWIPLGLKPRQQGPAVIGLWMLISVFHFLALTLGMLAPTLALGALMALQYWLLQIPFTAWQWPLMGLLVGALLALETAVLVLWAGRRWETLDPSQELIQD